MKLVCPKCKSKNIIPIVYGYPSSELFELSGQGKVKLGGCERVFGYMQSNRYCKDCCYDWHVDNLKCDDVKKVRFKFWKNFCCENSKEENQWAYDIYSNGKIKYCSYPVNSKNIINKVESSIDALKVNEFYDDLLFQFKPWSYAIENTVEDGCSYELVITYTSNQTKKHTGDISGGSIESLVLDFLLTVPDLNKTIK